MSQFVVDTKPLIDFLRSMDTLLVVPNYQRGYSWKNTELDELLTDLGSIGSNEYLIGSMIFIQGQRNSLKVLDVVDGQQRLTTLFILISELQRTLEEFSKDNSRAQNEMERLKSALYDIDTAGSRLYKLELGGVDKDFFKDLVCENKDITPSKSVESNIRLADAKKALGRHVAWLKDEKGLAGLLDMVDRLKKITLISIYVANEGDAYTIFEAINDRGADLTVADLLKNFLLKIAHQKNGDTDRVKDNWEAVISTLGELKITDLLTYYWRAKKENVTSSKLFKAIKTHLDEQNYSPSKFTEELLKAAEAYRKIEYPEEYGLDRDLRDVLIGIKATGFRQWYPLMIAAIMQNIDRDDLMWLFRNIERTSVYLKIVGFNPSELEQKYVNWANRMLVNGKDELAGINSEIQDEFKSQHKFEISFVENSFDVNFAKLVLIRAEQRFGKGDNNLDFEAYELEHIMPKRLGAGWEHIDASKHDDYLNDIGNLALLAKVQNIKGSNKAFELKKAEYANSRVKLTQALYDHPSDKWDFDDIKNRGKELLEHASVVWGSKE